MQPTPPHEHATKTPTISIIVVISSAESNRVLNILVVMLRSLKKGDREGRGGGQRKTLNAKALRVSA